jgi:hypothetical protein
MLDTTTVIPLLLHVFDKLGKPEQAGSRRSILTDIESFMVRRLVSGLTAKSYNNFFLEAIKLVAEADANQIGVILREYLLSQTSDTGRWPNDDEFQEEWRKVEVYRYLKPQMRLRMILEALELHKRSGDLTEENFLPKKKLSVEHIMPRGWAANWLLSEDTAEAKDAREALIHTFGNLTLVTSSLNSTLSNDPWSKKQKTLRKHSSLLLNADLQEADVWDEEAIKSRGKDLFKMAKKIWPYRSI